MEIPLKFSDKEMLKAQVRWKHSIIKSYDNEFRRIEREHEDCLKEL
jgi:hypothetical protein